MQTNLRHPKCGSKGQPTKLTSFLCFPCTFCNIFYQEYCKESHIPHALIGPTGKAYFVLPPLLHFLTQVKPSPEPLNDLHLSLRAAYHWLLLFSISTNQRRSRSARFQLSPLLSPPSANRGATSRPLLSLSFSSIGVKSESPFSRFLKSSFRSDLLEGKHW